MKLIIEPKSTDFSVYASYKEAMISLIEQQEKRTALFRYLLETFSLRLDDIKVDNDALSGNFIHFVKYYGTAVFNVSLGLEEATLRIFRTNSKEQALDLYGKIFQILDEIPISLLRINISQQLSAETNVESYLESLLNPNPPSGFKEVLSGRGVQYNLKIPKHNLVSYVSLSSSLYLENGIFLAIENQFSPYVYDFQTFSKIIIDYYEFALKELGIQYKKKKKNG